MEKLIETVHAYTVLYNLQNLQYKNNQVKANAWAKVAEELEIQDGRPTPIHTLSIVVMI